MLQVISLVCDAASELVVSKIASISESYGVELSCGASEPRTRNLRLVSGACLESKVRLVACDSPRCEYYDIALVSNESPFLDLCRAKCGRISRR